MPCVASIISSLEIKAGTHRWGKQGKDSMQPNIVRSGMKRDEWDAVRDAEVLRLRKLLTRAHQYIPAESSLRAEVEAERPWREE